MTYEELKEKCMFEPWDRPPTEEELATKCVVKLMYHDHGSNKYKVLSNPEGLLNQDIALFCDGGNLCFGFGMHGGYIAVYTD